MDIDGGDGRNLVKWALRGWRDHPEFEDLCQNALVQAWLTVERLRRSGQPLAESTVVVNQARWSVRRYLRSPQALNRLPNSRSRPPPQIISLDGLLAQYREEGRDLDQQQRIFRQDDFAPALTERLAAAEHWRSLLRHSTERERQALYLRLQEGVSYREAGVRMGVGATRAEQLVKRAVDRYRERLGLVPAQHTFGARENARRQKRRQR